MDPKLVAITKISHMLSVKIKKHQYFLFCRIQAEWKKKKSLQTPSLKPQANSQSIISKQNNNQSDPLQNQSENKEKGLLILHDFISLHQTKNDKTNKIKYSFQQIFNNAQKKIKTQKLYQNLNKIYKNNLKNTFTKIQNQSKYFEKVDIFFNYTQTIFTPKIRKVFNQIRDHSLNINIPRNPSNKQAKQSLQNQTPQQKQTPNQPLTSNLKYPNLKPITQEQSSAFSDDQSPKYITPQKQSTKFNFNLQQKTLKKQSTKTEAIFQNQHPNPQNTASKTSLIQKQNHQQNLSKVNIKIQPKRTQITLLKATKITTKLQDQQQMNFNIQNSNECLMFKQNHIYSDNLHQLIPDLHDNMGVFESIWKQNQSLNTEFGSGLSQRTIDKNSQIFNIKQNQKTFQMSLNKYTENNQIFNEISNTQINSSSRSNHKDDQQTVTSTSRINKCIKNVPFVTQAINLNQDSTGSFGKFQENDNFYSSPADKNIFHKIPMDLAKCLHKQKLNQTYINSTQTHKVSVNLPRKSSFCPIKSQYGSANKINSYKTTLNQQKSIKKSNQNESFKRFSYKQQADYKQNMQQKVQKQKFIFYTTSKSRNKQENKKYNNFNTINQSQLTARKIQKEIQNIMKNKNINIYNHLKISKNK